jgi:hypothetical protein
MSEQELTFDMLHVRKPKRGTCLRCFSNPTYGILQVQVFNRAGNNPSSALASLTTSLCEECLELMYRALAVTLTEPVSFGDICPRCQKSKPVVGRIMLTAKQIVKAKRETASGNQTFKSLATSTYKFCESCTVHMYRNAGSVRDNALAEGAPVAL